jgi:hypothetical protein
LYYIWAEIDARLIDAGHCAAIGFFTPDGQLKARN